MGMALRRNATQGKNMGVLGDQLCLDEALSSVLIGWFENISEWTQRIQEMCSVSLNADINYLNCEWIVNIMHLYPSTIDKYC